MPQYKEQWIVVINRKEFVIDEIEKVKLEEAMKKSDRWFKTVKGDILSISHIESVTLHSKTIKNGLGAGNKVIEEPTEEEKSRIEYIKRQTREKLKNL